MLAIITDIYTPLLALFCVFYFKSKMNKPFVIAFVIAVAYVYLFAFIEHYFSWWLSMGEDFSSHTAIVMVMVFALLSAHLKIGIGAFISALGYGALMNTLNYHSWFDILTTMFVCLPCYFMFTVAKKASAQG